MTETYKKGPEEGEILAERNNEEKRKNQTLRETIKEKKMAIDLLEKQIVCLHEETQGLTEVHKQSLEEVERQSKQETQENQRSQEKLRVQWKETEKWASWRR
ncbi:hypothetical protein WMY93_001280 [Mugilogobius chulae]|uniref:Uncharacterized protein n=1 Tax=Mugilogobius chulae TaxID=88201 RepID=A0AAW0QCC1_9GOBI